MEGVNVYAMSGGYQATAKVVIKDFVELMAASKPGDCYPSAFMVGEVPMIVNVFPNGSKDEYTGFVSIFLRSLGTDPIQVKCKFTTDVLSTSFEETFDPTRVNMEWGYPKFASHDRCLEEYQGKDFVVTAEVRSPGLEWKVLETKFPAACPKEFSVWEKVFTNMEKSDFILIFEGQEVACHKIILAAASPVLRALVENQHREAIESKANINISEDIGRAFVRYVYTGKLEEAILKEHAPAFLELGEMYDLRELKSTAEQELMAQLDLKSMVRLLSIGELFRLPKSPKQQKSKTISSGQRNSLMRL